MELCPCHRAHGLPPGRRALPVRETSTEIADEVEITGGSCATGLKRTGEATACRALTGAFPHFSVASLPRLFEMAREHDPARVTHVLYHQNCLDGMTAAWAAWKRLGDSAEYVAVNYQSPVPDLPPEARVAVVDFSFPAEQMRELREKVADVIVLDHHDTARERLSGEEFRDYVLVDEQRAGAGLSWHYFHPNEPLPALVAYAEDRDLWRFDLELSAEVNKAMASHPFTLPAWDRLDVTRLKSDGVEIFRFLKAQNEQLADLAHLEDVGGYRVPVINTPVNVDELAAVVLKRFPEAPFMGTYWDDADGNRRWEVRSRSGFVVNQVAARFGGGGHKEAAGFMVRRNEPLTVGPSEPYRDLPCETEAQRRFARQQVEAALTTARLVGEVPVANSPLNVQAVGKALLRRYPAAPSAAVYYDGPDGQRRWHLVGR